MDVFDVKSYKPVAVWVVGDPRKANSITGAEKSMDPHGFPLYYKPVLVCCFGDP